MGQMADDMIDGLTCSWCGIFFKEEHGFPVACHDCFDEVAKENPKDIEVEKWKFQNMTGETRMHKPSGVQRATIDEL